MSAVFILDDCFVSLNDFGQAFIGGSLRQRDRVAMAPGLRSGDPEFKVLEGSGQLS